ncbi:MAG: helix-turn-helix domain-containing protein [Oscillospiraceae bacterium]|nr:helix-turn-helix domain-containing protein [Oscillospiraceae bacterium]
MFYERYIELCKAKGISASAAATAIGFSKSSVSHWKNTGGVPRYEIIYKISEFFNVSPEELTVNTVNTVNSEQITNNSEQTATDVGVDAHIDPPAETEIITAEPEAAEIIEPEIIAEPEPLAEPEQVAEPETIAELVAEPLENPEPLPNPAAAVPEPPQVLTFNYSLFAEKSMREIRRGLRISLNTAAREIGVSPEELKAYEDGNAELRGYRKTKLEKLLQTGRRL